METPLNEKSSSFTAPKGKRHRRSAKPNGPQTQPATPNAEPSEKNEPTEAEKRKKLEFEANTLLSEAIDRFRQLGVKVITINETLGGVQVAWFRLQDCQFSNPRTENTAIVLTKG